MLLILDRVVAEVKLSEERKELDVLKLEYLLNAVEGDVEEAECAHGLKSFELDNSVLCQIQLSQVRQLSKTSDPVEMVVGKAKLFEVEPI